MITAGVIGMGNAGNQVATLAHTMLSIPAMAINSSEKDLETVPDGVIKIKITAKDAESKGAGKDRKLAKTYLKDSIINLLKSGETQEFISNLDLCFLVSSTGGGTGSGISPIMADILSNTFQDTKFILVGILPVDSESLDTQGNTLEYLKELYGELTNVTYMLYDNDKFSGQPSYKVLETVNTEIVKDIDVLRCRYNYTTKYDSIDDRDMSRIYAAPGKLTIVRLEGFRDKDCDNVTIEDLIIDKIKRNAHVEGQRDKKIFATGIITNLSQTLNNEFDDNIPKVVEFAGAPIHAFKHIYVNEDRNRPNNVFYIMAGGSNVNDRMLKISDRIQEIEDMQNTYKEESALDSIDLNHISDKISDKGNGLSEDGVDIKSTFAKFGL